MSTKVNKLLAPFLTVSVVAGFTPLVEAKEIKTQEDYQLYCGRAAHQYNVQSPDCPELQEIFGTEPIEQDGSTELLFESEPKRRNTRREKSSSQGSSGYLGTTILGVFFPERDFLDNGIGGSLFGGVKFGKFVGLDLELGGFFGNDSFDDLYVVWYSFLSPRFFLPLSPENEHLHLYISPGIGISQLLWEDFSDDARLTWQIKGGLSIPLYKRLGGYGEIRYADQFSDEGSGAFGTEFGITLKLGAMQN